MRKRFAATWARLICVLFVMAAAKAGAAPAHPLTLSELAARYEAWRGGSAFEQLKSLRVSMTTQGSNGAVWNLDQRATRDGWFRSNIGLPGAQLTTVATPFTVWRRCRNCQYPISDDAISAAALVQSLDFASALTPSASRKVELKGIERWNGAAWAVVRLGGEQGVDVFIKPATGRLGGVRRISDGRLLVTRYADWRRVGGVRFAYSLTQQDGANAPGTMHVKSVELDGGGDATLYARPADLRAGVFPPGETSTGWLKLEIDHRRGLLLPIQLDGRPALAILDSGALNTVVGSDGLAPSELKTTGHVFNRGASSRHEAEDVRGGEIGIGDLTLRDPVITVEDPSNMRALGAVSKDRPVVILGEDAFHGLIVDLDLPNERIAFHEAVPATDTPPGGIELSLTPNSWPYIVPVSIEGKTLARLVIDTGYYGAVAISPSFARDHNLPGNRPFSGLELQEVAGKTSVRITTLNHISIGGVTLKDAPAELFPAWALGDQIDGLLGRAVLQRFRIIFDVSRNRLWLVPSPDQIDAPFWHARLGIRFIINAYGARITSIYPNSPAEAAGLTPGDTIVTVNGDHASKANLGALANSRAGTHVRITLNDGSQHDIEISDFY